MSKYIILDTETTGNQQEDKIIQLGFFVISGGKCEVYNSYCKSDQHISVEAMEVHNIVPKMIENEPYLKDTIAYKKLNEINSGDNYIFIHNANFDLDMLKKDGFTNNMKVVDTLRCAKHLYKELDYHRLQYLRYKLELYKSENIEAKKLNIDIKSHDAIGDVLILKLFSRELFLEVKKQFPDEEPHDKLIEFTNTPVLLTKLKFGKYKNQRIEDIANSDLGYLKWMYKNLEIDEDLKFTLEKYI
jgi:DNA polymerase-3 subunit epsilon/exodeoxyribonuclease X